MAVYEHAYRGYRGALTPPRWRFLVLTRYALAGLFASRAFLATFVLCFVWPVVCALAIYLRHNADALEVFRAMGISIAEVIKVDAWVVLRVFLVPQSWFAFVLALIVGPALVSPDLRNNGMALYLSRPLGRGEYVLGKFAVLAVLLSAVTWVPGLTLIAFHSLLEGTDWVRQHGWVGASLFAACWIWILLLSLLALALSAWVKWKPLARLLFLGLFFVLLTFSTVINLLYRTDWGSLINLWGVRNTLWESLFRQPPSADLPVAAAWAAMLAFWGFCLLLLARKVKAYEVERG